MTQTTDGYRPVETPPAAISRWDKNLKLLFANPAFVGRIGFDLAQLGGKTIQEMDQPDAITGPWLEKMQQVLDTAQPAEHHHAFPTATEQVFWHIYFVPELGADGSVESVLAIGWDLTDQKKAKWNLPAVAQQTTERYRSLFNSLDAGFCIIEVLFDASGQAYDYCFLETNQAFKNQTGLAQAVGKTMKQLAPDHEQHWFDIYGKIAQTGQPVRFENAARALGHYYEVYAFRVDNPAEHHVAILFNDVTERKRAEEKLQQFNELLEQQVRERTQALSESRDLLQSIFDTTLLSFSVLQAVRDEKGEIIDFRIVMVNKELARETGRTDLVGKMYSVEYPGIKPSGLYDLMLQVVETGEPGQVEYYYPHEGFNKWYAAMFVKMDDGLIASNLDITERKLAEAEITRNFTILKQAEEVAGMGSWEFDYTTNSFHWSEGMYRLFGLPMSSAKSPETYLEYVLEADRPIADKLVHTITNHPQALEETMRIRVNHRVITLQVKATVLQDDLERPYKMMGVDLDVSRLKDLEQENLTIRLEQQKALLLAIMDVQQEERKRISESLHNGVGQILYATKLNLDQIAEQVPKEVIAPTTKLLSEAIQETRRVSHELVPMVLQDFGLIRAMHELCRNYEPSTLTVNCDVDLEGSLESYLELAIYRMAQELLTNVAKHAQATQVDLLLTQEDGLITLKVRDNGQGVPFNMEEVKGLGLRTISDRVKLLNGTFTLTTPLAGKGTLVVIQLPVPGMANGL